MVCALARCLSMRTAKVLMPRNTKAQSMGPEIAPVMICMLRTRLAKAASFTTTMPIITSEWPHKYLVAEWKITSTPMVMGCCKYGVAKVLSKPTKAPCWCAKVQMASMSTKRSKGLLGDSSHTIAGLCSASKGSTCSMSVKSANTTLMPQWAYTSVSKS